uniref:Uncharacterized protein n=1 Tax=Ditylenchus dipsaci TaxID=166011 RepID=A0A915DWG8_9BILA
MLCSKKYRCFLVLLDDGNPDEGPRKQMEFAKNTDMLPLYLQMNNVSIDLRLATYRVTRSEGCLDGDSDRQTWELTTINGPKCALFINWKKETFTITTKCLRRRDGDVTVISGKGSSSGNFPVPVAIFRFCVYSGLSMNFTISNVNSTGDCDLFLQFVKCSSNNAPIVSTTSPDDSILGTEQTNGVNLGGLETWKLGLIIGVCILLFLLLVGAVACFLIHRYCPDDPETDADEAAKWSFEGGAYGKKTKRFQT